MRKIKGILIDPFACTVAEVEHDGDDHRNIYKLISHESIPVVDTFSCAYHPDLLEEGDAVFVDENALLGRCERFFILKGYPQLLAGKGLVLGSDREGHIVSAATDPEAIKRAVKFAKRFVVGGRLTKTPWEKTVEA